MRMGGLVLLALLLGLSGCAESAESTGDATTGEPSAYEAWVRELIEYECELSTACNDALVCPDLETSPYLTFPGCELVFEPVAIDDCRAAMEAWRLNPVCGTSEWDDVTSACRVTVNC